MAGKKVSKKGGRKMAKKSVYRRRRMGKGGVPERASLTEITSSGNLPTATMFATYTTSLASSSRAQIVAQGYQYYRIKRITHVFKPLVDTFVAAVGSPPNVPYLYHMIDRTGELKYTTSAGQLRTMGAVPIRLDEKEIRRSWTPSVLNASFNAAASSGGAASLFNQVKKSPWLPCRAVIDPASGLPSPNTWIPDSTDHGGAIFIVDDGGAGGYAFGFERQVEYEFCKPARPAPLAGESQTPALDPAEYVPPQ